MPSLRLESATDSFDLDSVFFTGRGVQVLSGTTGLGLPSLAGQWLEGAGNGAAYRGGRWLARDVDLKLLVQGTDRADLKALARRLNLILDGPAQLVFVDDREEEWFLDVRFVGGGDYTYGVDTTGERDLIVVVTVRAGDPFWTRTVPFERTIEVASAARGLLTGDSLTKLQLSTSQTFGELTFDNPGDASAYPLWEIHGPATAFDAQNDKGELISWSGTLAAGDVLTIDHKAGTVIDQDGENRYDGIAPLPIFWAAPPDKSTGIVDLVGGIAGTSKVIYSWQPRRKAMI